MADEAALTIRIEDDGPPGATPGGFSPSGGAAAPPPAPPPAPDTADVAALIEQILKAPGVKQFGFTRDVLAKSGPDFVRDLADQLGVSAPVGGPPPAPGGPAGVPPESFADLLARAVADATAESFAEEFRGLLDEGAAGGPPPPPEPPGTYGFADGEPPPPPDAFGFAPDGPPPAPEPPPLPVGPPVEGYDVLREQAIPVRRPAGKQVSDAVGALARGEAGGLLDALGVGGKAVAGAGAAALAANQVAEGVAGKFRAAGDAAGLLGDGLEAITRNDAVGLFRSGVAGASKALETIPVSGKVFSAALNAYADAAVAGEEVIRGLVARGREISLYDGNLASAAANADARKLMADINEARVTGRSVGRVTDATSRIDAAEQDLFAVGKDLLAQALAPVLETLATVLEILRDMAPLLKAGADLIGAVVEWFFLPLKASVDGIKTLIEWGLKWAGVKPPAGELESDDMLFKFLDMINGAPSGPGGPDPTKRAAAQGLGLPLFEV